MEFDVGDYVWTILTKDCFRASEYNKLSTWKIGPLEIIEKINPNAYLLKLPSHIQTTNVFNRKLFFLVNSIWSFFFGKLNMKHLIPYSGHNSILL